MNNLDKLIDKFIDKSDESVCDNKDRSFPRQAICIFENIW
jgi:hypothetical protein